MRIRGRVMTLPWCLLAVLALGAATLAPAQTEGTDFRALATVQPTASSRKIEVTEFFSYGCPHCAAFFPMVNLWLAKLPRDVVFRRVPISFNRAPWLNLARAYYALQASGDLPKLDGALFHAIHEEHQQLFDSESLADWVGKNGGNAAKFAAAYTSFGVNNQTVQADKMAEDYGVDSIPILAVNGRYVAMADPALGEALYLRALLEHTDLLIAKARAESGAAHPAAKPKAR